MNDKLQMTFFGWFHNLIVKLVKLTFYLSIAAILFTICGLDVATNFFADLLYKTNIFNILLKDTHHIFTYEDNFITVRVLAGLLSLCFFLHAINFFVYGILIIAATFIFCPPASEYAINIFRSGGGTEESAIKYAATISVLGPCILIGNYLSIIGYKKKDETLNK